MSTILLQFLQRATHITTICVTMIGVIFISQLIIQNAQISAKSPIRLFIYLVAMIFGILVLIIYYLFAQALLGNANNKKQVIVSTLVISIIGIIIGAIKLQTNQTLGITLLDIFIPLLILAIMLAGKMEIMTAILCIGILLLISGIIFIALKKTGVIHLIEFMFIGSIFCGIGSIAIIGFAIHRSIRRSIRKDVIEEKL